MEIKSYKFSFDGRQQALLDTKGSDWPVVYLINNKNSLYIGETSSFSSRFAQHLDNVKKKRLTDIYAIYDDEYNKSAILDIEQSLIRMCSADQKFTLLNGNAGQSSKHNYYQREKYLNKIEGSDNEQGIWDRLKELGLVDKSYNEIVNSDIFKYSPYTSLTNEQEEVCFNVINDILNGLKKNKAKGNTCIINGAAGTGKTILAIYMMFIFTNANKQLIDTYKDEESFEYATYKNKVLHKLKKYVEENGMLKIGYVLPMTSIRSTLKAVFKNSKNGLKSSMVIGPTDVTKDLYDILIVDESHRLPKRKNIGWLGEYDNCCRKLELNPEKTNTLDWIVKCSKHRILFYDSDQSVKGSDITNNELLNSLKGSKIVNYKLTTQMRCQGGSSYIEYLDKFFKCSIQKVEEIVNYDIKVYDNANVMIDDIKKLNEKIGLCRNVAGYSWPWATKGLKEKDIDLDKLYDISFDDKHYLWNMSNQEWILREQSINEIGCIHTTQGYDLNYVGVILGKEIDYDEKTNEIIIKPDNFYDVNVKKCGSVEDLKRYIINAYKVMMARGIKGCYIYACNDNMNKYLKKYFS